VRWTKVHLNTFSLSEVIHHKVLDQVFRVFATAPASNPSGSALVTAPTRNPRGNSSMSLVSLWIFSLPVVRLNEGGVGP
jgi:hypothetical protein